MLLLQRRVSMKAISKYVSKKPDYRGLVSYNEIENNTWQTLIQQQLEIVKTRACDEITRGRAAGCAADADGRQEGL
jgi:phenylalanine-4-hydroxylase